MSQDMALVTLWSLSTYLSIFILVALYRASKLKRRTPAPASLFEREELLLSQIQGLTKYERLYSRNTSGHLEKLKKIRYDSIYYFKLYEILLPYKDIYIGAVDLQYVFDELSNLSSIDYLRFKYDRD